MRGEARGYQITPGGVWIPTSDWQPNMVLYDAATIWAELLRGSPDGKTWFLGGCYIEFENNGGAAVSPPTPTRSGGISYYDGLLSDPDRDYLRVALTSMTKDSSDLDLYPGGNRLTVFAQTEGVVGVHGKTFSDAVSSRVYGCGIVATPVFADSTQDRVHSRFYWTDSDNQLIKLLGSQIGISWRLTLL
jgi:hypothetical protein